MELELNKIYNKDCLEGMKKTPDNSIDLIVTETGSGTTGVTCKNFNRAFIGYELSEEYFSMVQDRLLK